MDTSLHGLFFRVKATDFKLLLRWLEDVGLRDFKIACSKERKRCGMIPTRPIFRKTEFELQLKKTHKMVQTCTFGEHRGEVDCSLRDWGHFEYVRTLQKMDFGKNGPTRNNIEVC